MLSNGNQRAELENGTNIILLYFTQYIMAALPPAGAGAGVEAGVVARAAPAVGPLQAELDFVQSLINVLRFSANQAANLVDNGYRSADDLLYWKYDENIYV